MTLIDLGQVESPKKIAARAGWAIVIRLNHFDALSQPQLTRYQRAWQTDGVLPLIVSSSNQLPPELYQAWLTNPPRLLLLAGPSTTLTRLTEQGGLCLSGFDAAEAQQLRDGDQLILTATGNGYQLVALRDSQPAWFEVETVAPGVIALTEPGHQEWVRSFLVLGQHEAALIDTGMGIADIRPVVESLTDLPVRVILTHAHWDHIGSVHSFERVAIHAAEQASLAEGAPLGSDRLASLQSQLRLKCFGRPLPPTFDAAHYELPGYPQAETLQEGDQIDLGGRVLDVLHTPGHSAGSISLLDQANRQLFIGDTLYYGPLYCEDFATYLTTTRRLAQLADQVERVFPSHNEFGLNGRLMAGQDLVALRDGFEQIAQGKIESTATPWYDVPAGNFSLLAGFPY